MWFWISFALLGLILYLPIGFLIWLILIDPLSTACKKQWENISDLISIIGVILLFTGAFLFHGGLFGWYDKIEKPDTILASVDDEVKNDFYQYREQDGKIYLTVSDKNFSETNKSHLTGSGDIHFNVKNKNAKKERANLKWTIEIDGTEYKRNTLPADTEIHLLSASFSLKVGETIAKVTAKNDLGEVSKTVVINKLSTESECAKSENAEVGLCKQLIAANQADAEAKAATETKNKSSSSTSSGTASSSTSRTNTSSGSSTTKCSYEAYGQCWDDVIEQAESDAWGDAYLYGDNFNRYPSYRGCDGVCADIYDDAYWKARDFAGDAR